MKKFSGGIFKHARSGNLDVEEDLRIEGCSNQDINDKYRSTPQNAPVYYADMLLHLTKNVQGEK